MTRRSWLLFAAMCVIWGIPYLLIRVAVRDVTPGFLVFGRTAIGGLILLPLALRAGGYRPVLRRWAPLLAFVVIEVAGPWLLLGDAETKLSSSLTGLLVAAVPLVGVLVARLTGTAERVDLARGTGLFLGVAGVVMLVGLDVGNVQARPLVEVALVAVGYAVGPVIMARSLSDLPSIPVVSATLLMCAIGYLPYAAFHVPGSIGAKPVASILVLLSATTFADRQELFEAEFYIMVLFSTAGLMLMPAGNELMSIYLALEVTSLSLAFLAAWNKRDTIVTSSAR